MLKKQQRHLEQLEVKPLFYYEDGVITVCLLRRDKEVLARGISVCSPLDQFVKKTGRAKALGMALRALIRKGSSGPMYPERFLIPPIHPLWKAHKFICRSWYMPELTEKELAIMSKAKFEIEPPVQDYPPGTNVGLP